MDRKAILEMLHKKEIVEVCEPDAVGIDFRDTANSIAQFEKYMQSAESALAVLDEYAPEKTGFFSDRRVLPMDKYGIRLVSTMEGIDETPSGMLLHGIMASIAEFYSRNLATEVMKGMTTKAKGGGTVSKAPVGYINVRKSDELGREYRTVILDEERAPFIRQAFELYATGDWTVNDLAEHLALQGFTTRGTPSMPSKPMDKRVLSTILNNQYYTGKIRFQGAYLPGKHESLVDHETWQKVQDVLESHLNGERIRNHPHFLKGTVYCGACGERLLVQYAKSRSGVGYPYYSCAGRHGKRNDCKQRSILIEEVERQMEALYHESPSPRSSERNWRTGCRLKSRKAPTSLPMKSTGLGAKKTSWSANSASFWKPTTPMQSPWTCSKRSRTP